MNPQAILDGIRIASPCPARWDEMAGDDRVRSCAGCGEQVHDLSALTTAEALALVAGPGPMPCLRLHRRADGTVLTADCPVGLRAARRRRGRLLGLLAMGATLLAAAVSALGIRIESPAPRSAPGDGFGPPPTTGVPIPPTHTLGKPGR